MPKPVLTLRALPGAFAVCRLAAEAPVPSWATGEGFFSITRTPDELSVVCPEARVPEGVEAAPGWSCLQVEGPLDLSQTGILACLADPLAQAGVPLFAISTFDTDYLLIPEDQREAASGALLRAGHRIQGEGTSAGAPNRPQPQAAARRT